MEVANGIAREIRYKGSAGASPALFGAAPKSSVPVSREARDTAGEAPALPSKSWRSVSIHVLDG